MLCYLVQRTNLHRTVHRSNFLALIPHQGSRFGSFAHRHRSAASVRSDATRASVRSLIHVRVHRSGALPRPRAPVKFLSHALAHPCGSRSNIGYDIKPLYILDYKYQTIQTKFCLPFFYFKLTYAEYLLP